MTKEDFTKVINYFKDENKTISHLNDLFQQGTTGQEALPKDNSISYLDAIFEFTNRALKDNTFTNNYYSFRDNIPSQTVYRNACKSISGQYTDVKIFNSWLAYLTENHLTLVPETKLKQILGHILVFSKEYYSLTADKFITFFTTQISVSMEDSMRTKDAKTIISNAIDNSTKKCVIFTGAPGTGKTHCVEDYVKGKMDGFKRSEYFVQFHSSYDYTDFVEGLRPIQKDGKMDFVRMDGIFKAFCRKVVALDIKRTYYFVIDEINRADLGRVFGELMYCFEKRGKEHKIATQYANLPVYDKDGNPINNDCFKDDGFYIPENIVIIGTMNDIDRSVETFDFALRRRFDWVEIKADEVMESSLISMKVPAAVVSQILPQIKAMNQIIENQSGLGPEFKIGPAYFKDYDVNKEPAENLTAIWERNIAPILQEYMRGRQNAQNFVRKCEKALKGSDPSPKSASESDSAASDPQP